MVIQWYHIIAKSQLFNQDSLTESWEFAVFSATMSTITVTYHIYLGSTSGHTMFTHFAYYQN